MGVSTEGKTEVYCERQSYVYKKMGCSGLLYPIFYGGIWGIEVI